MTTNDPIREKVVRIFAGRNHKYPDKKVEIIQDESTRNQRFIIAPYDQTINKIINLIEKEKKAYVRQVLPEKKDYPEMIHTTEQQIEMQEGVGFNKAIDEIERKLND